MAEAYMCLVLDVGLYKLCRFWQLY